MWTGAVWWASEVVISGSSMSMADLSRRSWERAGALEMGVKGSRRLKARLGREVKRCFLEASREWKNRTCILLM